MSVCEGSKAIAALIVSDDGTIISEGRNLIGEITIPNPRVSHAEVEVIRNLDIEKYPNVKEYTLYAAPEPCPMCMGTMVMGGIRNNMIAARDEYGGAMYLIEHSAFLKAKRFRSHGCLRSLVIFSEDSRHGRSCYTIGTKSFWSKY